MNSRSIRTRLTEGIGRYHLEIRHVTLLFSILLIFQIVVSFLHKASLQKSVVKTQEWYQQHSAERLANLTSTSLELLYEAGTGTTAPSEDDVERVVRGFNIILSQQHLSQNVGDLCLLIPQGDSVYVVDEGRMLYSMMSGGTLVSSAAERHPGVLERFAQVRGDLSRTEKICTILEGRQTFHVFVPFVPRGESIGAVYMRNTPDFSFITQEIVSSYDETSMTFSALILFGLLSMFYISSYTLRQRDEAQRLLFEKEKERLAELIDHQKETVFTKRIYHTHHKAEKVMGFIKDDLRSLTAANIEEVKERVVQYSNFIARVIYDMKWYDPPLHTIRSALFSTDMNSVLQFLIKNVFLRVSASRPPFAVRWELDERLPRLPINEFVIWEVFEPIIQNCVNHAGVPELVIHIRTAYDPDRRESRVVIADNGVGIAPQLLERDGDGIRRLFKEHVTTRPEGMERSGYGCYIAHEIATQRLGWQLDAVTAPDGGARFEFTIPHQV